MPLIFQTKKSHSGKQNKPKQEEETQRLKEVLVKYTVGHLFESQVKD